MPEGHGYPLYIIFEVSVRPIVLLGGKGVRLSTPFIIVFQKKKAWILPKSSTNLSDLKTCFFSPQNVAISKLFFFPSWICGDLSFFLGNFPKCSFHHLCFRAGLLNGFSSQKINKIKIKVSALRLWVCLSWFKETGGFHSVRRSQVPVTFRHCEVHRFL